MNDVGKIRTYYDALRGGGWFIYVTSRMNNATGGSHSACALALFLEHLKGRRG